MAAKEDGQVQEAQEEGRQVEEAKDEGRQVQGPKVKGPPLLNISFQPTPPNTYTCTCHLSA